MIAMTRCLSVLGLLTAAACKDSGCIEVTEAVPLLEEPYPLNYPSTKPMPNRALRAVEVGEHVYVDRFEGKDFLAFELVAAEGTRGYVILDQDVRTCRR